MWALTDPYQSVEHQDFHQVALELDPPASVPSAGLKVTDLAAVACLEVSASVPALPLADLDSPVPSVDTECQAEVSDQAAVSDQAVVLEVPVSACQADLFPLAPAREEAPEATALPQEVERDISCRAPEAFTVDSLPLSGVSHKAQATLVLAATTVVMDFPGTATATMLLVWATATD